jgi:hypothetical protein
MDSFTSQLEALGTALLLIKKLPATTVWALELTNDDDMENSSVLNIFYRDQAFADQLTTLLRLGEAIDVEDDFTSWRRGTLLISLIKEQPNG